MAVIGTSNILMSTVRDTLNEAGGSVGNELKSFFSTNANLNKWSKFKPVIYTNQPFLDDERRWKGDSGLCGFIESSIVFSSADTLVTAYKNKNTFVYDIPQGGTTEPMRLGDFRGYCTDSQAPIWDFYINGAFTDSNTSSIDCELVTNSPDTNIELLLSDISPKGANAANWYFGVIFELNTGTLIVKSSTTSIGSSPSFSTAARIFSVTKSDLGTFSSFKAYPCLCQYTNASHGYIMALPCAAAGGDLSSGGVSGEVIIQQAAVAWVGNTYYYTGVRLTFAGVLGYAKSLEGYNATVTIRVTHSDGTTNEVSETITLSHTDTDSTGKYYRMDYSRLVIWSLSKGDEFTMIVLGGSSGVSATSTPIAGGNVVPDI